jgi:hypothetical protein
LAGAQLRKGRYRNVNAACPSRSEIRGSSRDAETTTHASRDDAYQAGRAVGNPGGPTEPPSTKVSSTGQRGLKFRFTQKSRLRKMFKINYLVDDGNQSFRIRMLASVASG